MESIRNHLQTYQGEEPIQWIEETLADKYSFICKGKFTDINVNNITKPTITDLFNVSETSSEEKNDSIAIQLTQLNNEENNEIFIITTASLESIAKIQNLFECTTQVNQFTILYLNFNKNINDISRVANYYQLYNDSPLKKWIKLIPINKTIPLEKYNRKDYFVPIADVVLDNEIYMSGKNQGNKKRNTLIKFDPIISKETFNKPCEWLYLLVINGMIVKIGGTRTSIKGRIGSYLCGHHVEERGKSGDCSKTNGFIYNTFEFYLNMGCTIQMYGYELPITEITIDIFGEKKAITAQTFHAYESTFLEDYKKNYGDYPILCDNCDPNYKQ